MDDVAVGEDESIRSEEEAGRAAAQTARIAGHAPAPTLRSRAPGLDIHHGGADAVHGVDDGLGISVQHQDVVPGRHGTLDSTTSRGILASILRLRYSLPAFPAHSRLMEEICRTRHRATAGSKRRTVPGSSRAPGAKTPTPPPSRSSTASGTIRGAGSESAARSQATDSPRTRSTFRDTANRKESADTSARGTTTAWRSRAGWKCYGRVTTDGAGRFWATAWGGSSPSTGPTGIPGWSMRSFSPRLPSSSRSTPPRSRCTPRGSSGSCGPGSLNRMRSRPHSSHTTPR